MANQMTSSKVGILNMIVMYPGSGGKNGDREQDRVEREVSQDRPPEPPVPLERTGHEVTERDRRDYRCAVVGVVRRPQREAERQRRPRLPASLREPRHDV